MPMTTLAQQKKQLRALAHGLRPVVMVGHQGITDTVTEAVRHALATHELIKVRLRQPEDKVALANDIASRTDALLCGLAGHTVILYKAHPEKPKIKLSPV